MQNHSTTFQICPRCGECKPLSEFHRRSRIDNRPRPHCKACNSATIHDIFNCSPHNCVLIPCACGCGKVVEAMSKNSERYCPGHHKPIDIYTRFWSKVDKNGPIPKRYPELGPCWIWKAGTHRGYGQFRLSRQSGGMIKAHHFAWEEVNGPLPEGTFLCHHCDTPQCINPSHTFVGTHAANMADMVAKGRSLKGEYNPNSKLTPEKVVRIRERYAADGVSYTLLASEYGVTRSTIVTIITRRTWQHVP